MQSADFVWQMPKGFLIVNIKYAKANLSELIDRAIRGEEIIIARGTKPVVKLVPLRIPLERAQDEGVPERLPPLRKR